MSTSQMRSSQRGTVTALIIALVLCLMPAISGAQGTLAPVGQQVFLDNSGNPINNGKICTYAAGTSTPLATYSNQALTSANANPIRTNSAGRPTTGGVYLSAASYKFIVLTAGSDNTCSTGTTIWTQDNIQAIPTTNVALDVDGTAGEALSAGDWVYLSDGSGALTAGRWYKADADNTYSSSTAAVIGVVPTAIASGASGSIRLGGRISALSSLTAGDLYYISATAGGITATPPTNQWFVGKADSTTTLDISQNQGGVRLPDSDGTHSLVIKTTSDLTADRLLTLVTGDAARTVTIVGDATIGGSSPIDVAEGRLTLTTGTPVTTADVTAATTLYWALYGGNRIALYTGTSWTTVTLAELSIAVPATTSTMYDVFIDYTAGVPVLELVAWTNDTTRATALATQDGVYVQTGDADSRYVGSFRTTAVSGQTEDSFAKRYVWNYYNRVPRVMRVLEAANSWTVAGTSFGQANASAANQLDFVIGVAEVALSARVVGVYEADTVADEIVVTIGLDSTTAAATGAIYGFTQVSTANDKNTIIATLETYPAIGRHVATWLERGSATTTGFGDNGGTADGQSGISGSIQG